MLVIDPPAAPSCTVQFTAELLVPNTLAVNDWVAPWLRFAVGGEIETTMEFVVPPPVPPPPQPVSTTSSASRTSRTRAPILVFMGASLSAHGGRLQITKRESRVRHGV